MYTFYIKNDSSDGLGTYLVSYTRLCDMSSPRDLSAAVDEISGPFTMLGEARQGLDSWSQLDAFKLQSRMEYLMRLIADQQPQSSN